MSGDIPKNIPSDKGRASNVGEPQLHLDPATGLAILNTSNNTAANLHSNQQAQPASFTLPEASQRVLPKIVSKEAIERAYQRKCREFAAEGYRADRILMSLCSIYRPIIRTRHAAIQPQSIDLEDVLLDMGMIEPTPRKPTAESFDQSLARQTQVQIKELFASLDPEKRFLLVAKSPQQKITNALYCVDNQWVVRSDAREIIIFEPDGSINNDAKIALGLDAISMQDADFSLNIIEMSDERLTNLRTYVNTFRSLGETSAKNYIDNILKAQPQPRTKKPAFFKLPPHEISQPKLLISGATASAAVPQARTSEEDLGYHRAPPYDGRTKDALNAPMNTCPENCLSLLGSDIKLNRKEYRNQEQIDIFEPLENTGEIPLLAMLSDKQLADAKGLKVGFTGDNKQGIKTFFDQLDKNKRYLFRAGINGGDGHYSVVFYVDGDGWYKADNPQEQEQITKDDGKNVTDEAELLVDAFATWGIDPGQRSFIAVEETDRRIAILSDYVKAYRSKTATEAINHATGVIKGIYGENTLAFSDLSIEENVNRIAAEEARQKLYQEEAPVEDTSQIADVLQQNDVPLYIEGDASCVESCLKTLDPSFHLKDINYFAAQDIMLPLFIAGEINEKGAINPSDNKDDHVAIKKEQLRKFFVNLVPEKKYFCRWGKTNELGNYSILEFDNGRWQAIDGDVTFVLFDSSGNVPQTALNTYFDIEEDDWGSDEDKFNVQAYEVTDIRVQLLKEYLILLRKSTNQQEIEQALKKIQLTYHEKLSEQTRQEIEQLSNPKFITKDGKQLDASAEQALMNAWARSESFSDRYIKDFDFYKANLFLNSEQINLIDALICAGELNDTEPRAKVSTDVFVKEKSNMLDALKHLDLNQHYLLRLEKDKQKAQYYDLFYCKAQKMWCYATSFSQSKPFSASGHLAFSKEARDLFKSESTDFSAIFIRNDHERLKLLDRYVRDYRYYGKEKAMTSIQGVKLNEGDAVTLLDGTEYRNNTFFGVGGSHNAQHSCHILPNNLLYQNLTKKVPANFDTGAKFDNFVDSLELSQIKNTCVDRSIRFLEHMYSIESPEVNITQHHSANQVGIDVGIALMQANQRTDIVEPLYQGNETHRYVSGNSEDGAMSWLNSLDKYLPYMLTYDTGTGDKGHSTVLFFHKGDWFLYDSNVEGLQKGNKGNIVQISYYDEKEYKFKLTPEGCSYFVKAAENWGDSTLSGIKSISYTYSAMDLSRVKFLRNYIELVRMQGEQLASISFDDVNAIKDQRRSPDARR